MNNAAWMQSKKSLVNGALLATMPTNSVVTLLGKVASPVERASKFITVQTSDNQKVQVKFDYPLTDPLTGYIEINGKVLNKTEILCLNFVSIADELVRNFDFNMYNQAVELCHDIYK